MCSAVLAIALCLAAVPGTGGELIANGGMEPPFGDRPTQDERRPFHGSRSLRRDLDGQADQLATRLIELSRSSSPAYVRINSAPFCEGIRESLLGSAGGAGPSAGRWAKEALPAPD